MGVQLFDALEQRWVSREHPRQPFGKKHVRCLFRVRRRQLRALREHRDLDQRILQPIGIARELYAGCVSKPFSLA